VVWGLGRGGPGQCTAFQQPGDLRFPHPLRLGFMNAPQRGRPQRKETAQQNDKQDSPHDVNDSYPAPRRRQPYLWNPRRCDILPIIGRIHVSWRLVSRTRWRAAGTNVIGCPATANRSGIGSAGRSGLVPGHGGLAAGITGPATCPTGHSASACGAGGGLCVIHRAARVGSRISGSHCRRLAGRLCGLRITPGGIYHRLDHPERRRRDAWLCNWHRSGICHIRHHQHSPYSDIVFHESERRSPVLALFRSDGKFPITSHARQIGGGYHCDRSGRPTPFVRPRHWTHICQIYF
jgi:hypothetical protein